jgi:hypothetical protein
VAISLLGAARLAAQETTVRPAPEQPIPFSHKVHAGDSKIRCRMCHANADPGWAMGIAQAPVCMQCHSAIKTGSPAIQKLAEFAKSGREIAWARVYEVPDYVYFSHRAHLDAGNRCEECHGPVAERVQLAREGDISMGGCMECHRVKKARFDCNYCHGRRR